MRPLPHLTPRTIRDTGYGPVTDMDRNVPCPDCGGWPGRVNLCPICDGTMRAFSPMAGEVDCFHLCQTCDPANHHQREEP